MEFELKTYKVFKIKYYLKKNNLFFFYTTTSLDLQNWLPVEQTLKKSNLNYYRLFNTLAIKTIKASIYKNFKQLIHSVTMFVNPQPTISLKLKILVNLEKILTLLSIKLNNKIYSISQLENLIFLNYNFNILQLYQFFIIYFASVFKITQKKFRNNVI
jgi:hypothetical protein